MRRLAAFAAAFLVRPERAADDCARPDALADALTVYALWVAASLLYLQWKPHDFPDAYAPARAEGLRFWLRVALWEPVLAAMNLALTGLVLEWMRSGWLALRTAVATLWSAVPLILTIAYTRSGLPRAAFGAGILVWAVPGALVARRIGAGEWRRLAAFLLGLNAISLLLLLPEVAAAVLRSDFLYKATLGVSVVWLLACGGLGLRRLCRASLARAVLAFLFANLVLNVVIAAAYLLHWLPMEVLKVLVYV